MAANKKLKLNDVVMDGVYLDDVEYDKVTIDGVTYFQKQTATPVISYVSKGYTTITWRYTNNDDKAVTVYAKLDSGSYVNLGSVNSGYYVDKQWTGLSADTPHNTTTYGTVSPRLDSAVSAVSANVTTSAYQRTATFAGLTSATPSSYAPQTVDSGDTISNPGSPTRTDYDFTGWSPSLPRAITVDTVFTAQWDIKTYTVTFKDGNNDTFDTQYINYGSDASNPGTPTKSATTCYTYSFDNWDSYINITADRTVDSNFTDDINTYTASFDYSIVDQTIDCGSSVISTATPTRTGYTFDSWSPAFAPLYANQSYTALWNINVYTVTYSANGGTGTTTHDFNYGTLGSTVDNYIPSVSRSGYNLTGWSPAWATVTSDKTYYAQWEEVTVYWTASFDSGLGSPDYSDQEVLEGDSATYPGTASRTCYPGTGWSPSLVALYADQNYTATYGSIYQFWASFDGLTGAFPTSYDSQQISCGSSASAPAVPPQKDGYTFDGWSPSFGAIYANQTYTAQWTAIDYTITFNANSGITPSPTNKTVTYNSTYGTLATTTRSGYTFNGWFTSSSGGTEITSSTTVSIVGNDTLYAQWRTGSQEWVYLGTSGTYDFSVVGTPVDVCKLANSSDALAYLEANYPAAGRTIGDEARVEIFDTATPIPADCGDYYFDVQAI